MTTAAKRCRNSRSRRLWSTLEAVLILAVLVCPAQATASTHYDERLAQAAEDFVRELVESVSAIVSQNLDPAFLWDRTGRAAVRSALSVAGETEGLMQGYWRNPEATANRSLGACNDPNNGQRCAAVLPQDTVQGASGSESLLVYAASPAESAAVASALPELESFLRRQFDWATVRDIISVGLEYELGYTSLSKRDIEEEIVREYARVLRSVLFFYSGREAVEFGPAKLHPNGDFTVNVQLSNSAIRPLDLRVRLRPQGGREFLILDIGYKGTSILRVARAREFERWLARPLSEPSSRTGQDPTHE